ncbi:MAG: hypothetical protein LBR36_09205 [Bacteroidales bacterium]|jgi:hypothetical protein|nr:hypothetical protein [Bacteroidales bacterium]
MIQKINLCLAMFFLSNMLVFSQSVTEVRIIKTTALDVYEQYVGIINKLNDGSVYNEDNFLHLFDENATIYSDILPDKDRKTQPKLSPQEYFDKFTKNIEMIYCKDTNFDLQFPSLEQNQWTIKCEFVRQIRFKAKKHKLQYRNECKCEYPEWQFNYIITITMDTVYDSQNKKFKNAKIQKIEVKDPLSDFFIIENMDKYNLVYENKKIDKWDKEYNSRMFSATDYNINRFTILSKNNENPYFQPLNLSQDKDDTRFYEINKSKKNLFGIGIDYAPISIEKKINSTVFPNITQKNQAFSFSIYGGIQLGQKSKTTTFFNIKPHFNFYQSKFNGDYITQYNAIDSDNDPYLRKINISSLFEKVNILTISIPVSFEFFFQLTKSQKNPVFFSLELGGYAEYRFFIQNKFNINAYYSAIYDYFGGIEFDKYYDYGYFDLNQNDISQSLKNKINSLDYGAFGALGLWFALNKNNLLKFSITYKHGFQAPMKFKTDYVPSENYYTYETLLQNVNSGLQNISFGLVWSRAISVKK